MVEVVVGLFEVVFSGFIMPQLPNVNKAGVGGEVEPVVLFFGGALNGALLGVSLLVNNATNLAFSDCILEEMFYSSRQ